MQLASRRALLLLLLAALAPRPALAQESHKFSAKALEAKYALPVYPPKGSVVGNEVIESTNDSDHHLKTAIWSVKGAELKKALDFYGKALGEPKKEITDVGGEKYTFDKQEEGTTRRRVVLLHDKVAHQVQIQIFMRTYESAADAE